MPDTERELYDLEIELFLEAIYQRYRHDFRASEALRTRVLPVLATYPSIKLIDATDVSQSALRSAEQGVYDIASPTTAWPPITCSPRCSSSRAETCSSTSIDVARPRARAVSRFARSQGLPRVRVQRELARVDSFRLLCGVRRRQPHLRTEVTKTEPKALSTLRQRRIKAMVIGGSAGGIDAVTVLLSALPRPLIVPVLVVLHIAAGSRTQWPIVFRSSTAPVLEAEDKDVADPGNVYIAPPDYHLLVNDVARLSSSADEKVNHARPSIGANADGSAGLAAIRERGGGCWVQAPETAVAAAMPKAAIETVPDALVLSLREMADALRAWVA